MADEMPFTVMRANEGEMVFLVCHLLLFRNGCKIKNSLTCIIICQLNV